MPDELTLARDLAAGLAPEQRNAVHARVLAAVLNEVAQDGRVSRREEIYLAQVRELLGQLPVVFCATTTRTRQTIPRKRTRLRRSRFVRS